MRMQNPLPSIGLLAEHPELILAVGELRWREWGRPPEPESLDWWVDATARESGRDALPVTWVAFEADGRVLGAVGLGEFDIEERRDRSPWVLGMVVEPAQRNRGTGGRLMRALEGWAAGQGYTRLWVATGGRAVDFYRKCGWEVTESFVRLSGEHMTILTRSL